MARTTRFLRVALGASAVVVIVALVLWIGPDRQRSKAQDTRPPGPLISRGYTEAPAGTVVIAGDPAGGEVVLQLRVTDGQKVKRDDIIAVLSNYPTADVEVRAAEAQLLKAQQQREAMVSGYRTAEIAMQEVVVKAESDTNKLKQLQFQRSSMPPDEKQHELNISQQNVEREQAKLKLQKETLAADLAQIETEISILTAKLDNAKNTREQALVRAPLDGVIAELYSRQGERIHGNGIAKIVDLDQVRILAEIDDIHVSRVVVGGKVEVTFRGSPIVHKGTISRVSPMVKRLKRSQADLGEGNVNLVEVEIKLDDPANMPRVLSRETRVIYL
jgi:multidrug resistance efflux pump